MNFDKKSMPEIMISGNLSTEDTIITMGSCFADNMAEMLLVNKFNVISNPFGVIYHPIPIRKILEDAMCSTPAYENEFVLADGLWRWWYGHSSLADRKLYNLQNKIISLKNQIKNGLSSENAFLILTFGTSYLYELKENRSPVANCHKIPADNFSKRFTPYSEFLEDWKETIAGLIKKTPRLHIIFTISPVRHIKDGLHQNNLSKANLLLFVEQLQSHFPQNTLYFPAYELMLDTLRDYQYFREDTIHPGEKAIKFILEQFATAYFDERSKDWVKRLSMVRNELDHRPLHPDSDSFKKFIPALERKLSSIISLKPHKDWSAEIIRIEKLKQLIGE